MEIEKQIEILESCRKRLSEYDYENLASELDKNLPNLPFTIYNFKNRAEEIYNPANGGSNIIYRAQALDDGENPFRYLQRISYRKDKDDNSEFGRLNKPKQSMFYASKELD